MKLTSLPHLVVLQYFMELMCSLHVFSLLIINHGHNSALGMF